MHYNLDHDSLYLNSLSLVSVQTGKLPLSAECHTCEQPETSSQAVIDAQ